MMMMRNIHKRKDKEKKSFFFDSHAHFRIASGPWGFSLLVIDDGIGEKEKLNDFSQKIAEIANFLVSAELSRMLRHKKIVSVGKSKIWFFFSIFALLSFEF